jgi:hypothetical protein
LRGRIADVRVVLITVIKGKDRQELTDLRHVPYQAAWSLASHSLMIVNGRPITPQVYRIVLPVSANCCRVSRLNFANEISRESSQIDTPFSAAGTFDKLLDRLHTLLPFIKALSDMTF